MTDFTPDWVSPPGDTIEDLLEERGWSQKELAVRMGVSKKHVNDLVQGRARITGKTAVALSTALGSVPVFWLTRETNHRASVEHDRRVSELPGSKDWLRELPVAWMAKNGWIPRRTKPGEKVLECLRFFGVSSVEAWTAQYQNHAVAFRASDKLLQSRGRALAWLRKVELVAEGADVGAFSVSALRARLDALRELAREPNPDVFIPELTRLCAEAGVVLVLLPHPPRCPIHGATLWMPTRRTVLALTLRYKSDDVLWFSFFHEIAHLLLHGKQQFIEGINGQRTPEEDQADAFAQRILIPETKARGLRGLQSKSQVRRAAHELGLSPGIVVGRMQHEGWLPRTHMNDLKIRYEWSQPG